MKYVIYAAIVAALTAVHAWIVMVTIGVVHAVWLPILPTLGYWPTMGVSLLVGACSLPTILTRAAGTAILGSES